MLKINAIDIKRRLLNNHDEIVKILEDFDFENIKVKKDYIFFSHSIDSSPTGCNIKLNDHLYAKCYTKNIEGDIYSFLMQMRKLTFSEILRRIKKLLNITNDFKPKQEVFGGFFKQVKKIDNRRNAVELELENIIDEEELSKYDNGLNLRFLQDNISLEVQKEFRIGYDVNSDRISVIWNNYEGEPIGIMGRYNSDNLNDIPKWLPIIPFPKSQYLFGYSENYSSLYGNSIYIGESEKFVLQLATYNYRNALALGCSSISEVQIKNLLALNPKEIIFCFDEGLDVEVIKKNVLKVKNYIPLLNIKVGVLLDRSNKYISKDSKASPSDLGKEVFESFVQECIIYV